MKKILIIIILLGFIQTVKSGYNLSITFEESNVKKIVGYLRIYSINP